MKSQHYKNVSCFLLVLCFLFAAPHVNADPAKETRVTSWWAVVFPQNNPEKVSASEKAAENANSILLKAEDTGFETKVDLLRSFVARNAVNKIDTEYHSYGDDVPVMLQKLMNHERTGGGRKPHMECSSRAAVLYYQLKQAGIRARFVILKAEGEEELSHTYLEVLNPATSEWEITDPLFNIYWISKTTKNRVSTADLLKADIKSEFIPCRTPDDCGYTKASEALVHYFSMASILDLDGGQSPLLINPDRYSMNRAVQFNKQIKLYCLARPKICPQEIVKIYEQK